MEAYKQNPMTTSSHEHQSSKSFPARKAQLAAHQLPGFGRCSLGILASLVAIVCLCLGFSVANLHAQGYGSISGTVADPSGAVIPGASVVALEVQTGNQTRTVSGKDGRFVFPTLLPSGYTLSVSAAGFESYAQSGIVLDADQALTINLVLKIGAQTQTVSVNAEAAHVDTTTGTLSQVINSASVQDLPLNGRAAAQLVTLIAGVVDASNENNGANQGSGKTFSSTSLSPVETASVNGTLPNQDNFLLDGGNNLDEMTNVNDPYPMPDSVQEFSVQTSNYDAEFGQSAGAVVNIVTKSGGEAFHGDLFEYLRNGFFNAENHFNLPGAQDTYHRHQFGGTIGGPVKIPHISSGKTTQFFYGYQYTLIHLGSAANSFTAPTAAEEGLSSSSTGGAYADFSNLCNSASGNTFNSSGICVNSSGTPVTTQQIYNVFAATSTPYPYNHIPSSAFDPASVALTKFFPVATSDAGPGKIGNTIDYFAATQNYFNESTARVDHEFGANDRMFARYFYDWYQQPAIFNPADEQSYTSYFQTRYQNAAIAETHTFTPNILNNLVLNYQREVSQRGGPPGSEDITALAPSYPLASIWQPTVGPYWDPTISGYFKAASSASALFERNNYTFNDDIHWVKGQHNFAFGGHYELSKFDVVNVYNSYGIFDFATTSTISVANNNAFANYMEGFMQTFEQGEFELDNDRGHFPAIYADDSWKVNRRLTLDYGLRWEMFAPGTTRMASRPHSAPRSMWPTRARLNTLFQRPREPQACPQAWCFRATPASRSMASGTSTSSSCRAWVLPTIYWAMAKRLFVADMACSTRPACRAFST